MATGGVFERGMLVLENLGLTDVLLPFLLIFTIVFAVLQKTEMFGKTGKNFNVMIALILALGVIIPHITGYYPGDFDVVNIINRALPNVSMIIVLILMALLMIGIFAGGPVWKGNRLSGIVALIAFIVVIYIFGAAADLWSISQRASFLIDGDTQAVIVVILVFALLVWFITKEEKTEGSRLLQDFGEMFKK